MVNQHLVINNMVPVSFQSRSSKPTCVWRDLRQAALLPSESTDWMSCCTSSCSLPWKVSTRFPCSIRTPLFIFFLPSGLSILVTINVSLSRLNFYFNAVSVHGRSCRPSVESADCIEIPPASERVFLEIPSSCLIAKTQPVTSYIYIYIL